MTAFACRPHVAGVLLFAGLVLGGTGSAWSESLSMQVGGWANPPVGYIDFCRNFGGECRARGDDRPVQLTEERWRELQEITTVVNRAVQPVTDLEYYQRDEVWTLPEAFGDCEDYVLLKRKRLVDRGWPTGALLVTVVFDEVGDGHAVLLARTTLGDFVLDNKTDKVRRWYETAYRYVKRQSVNDPNNWVSVGNPRGAAQSTAAAR